MSEAQWLLVVAGVLVIAVPFDIYVAARFVIAALERPRIPILTLAALRSIAIAVAASIAGVLGAASIWFAWTGERLLPTPIGAILIAVALIVISIPNVYALRLLTEDDPL